MRHFIAIAVSLFSAAGAISVWADETRNARPNVISLEFFGRNITYSLNYDRALGPDWAIGLGWGRVGLRELDGTDNGEAATLLPLYGNFYILRDSDTPFITASATFLLTGAAPSKKTNSPTLEFPENSLLTSVGVGYESRSHIGFIFRVTGYVIGGKTLLPWIGASAGWTF